MLKRMMGGNGRLWIVHPEKVYLPCCGVHRIMEYGGVCRIMIKSNDLIDLSLFRSRVTFEIHYGMCVDPRVFDEYDEYIRIRRCKLKRQWIPRPTAVSSSDQRAVRGWFEFEGELDHCPWLLVR